MSSRRTVIAIVAGCLALACVCMAVLAVVGAVAYLGASSQQSGIPLPFVPTPTPAATQTSAEMTAAMDQIEQQVIGIRGLSASKPVDRQLMTSAELRDYNLKEFEKTYSRDQAKDDTVSLAAFGLLDPSFKLYDFYVDLYSEDILGFYDDEVGKLFIITDRGRLDAVERNTFAHEFQHALQDQNYGIEAMGLSDEGWKKDSERAAGVQALIEGEATLLEGQWRDKDFTQSDWNDYNSNAYANPNSAYFRAPAYLQKDFYFPYNQGYLFVKRLYDRGGWAEVDKAFKNPPVSTEQILHPEKYDAGEAPQIVATTVLTDTLGSGWRQVDSNVMGEWFTSLVLEQSISEKDAATAAAGGGGDHYTVSYNESANQTAVVWQTAWDTSADAEEFVDAFKNYGDARFGAKAQTGNGSLCWATSTVNSCLYFTSQSALWVFAPDAATREKVEKAAGH